MASLTLDIAKCRASGCDDVQIKKCQSVSGKTKELSFNLFDRCYHVRIDGQEKFMSDSEDTAAGYFDRSL